MFIARNDLFYCGFNVFYFRSFTMDFVKLQWAPRKGETVVIMFFVPLEQAPTRVVNFKLSFFTTNLLFTINVNIVAKKLNPFSHVDRSDKEKFNDVERFT